jgi:hypothetical protein
MPSDRVSNQAAGSALECLSYFGFPSPSDSKTASTHTLMRLFIAATSGSNAVHVYLSELTDSRAISPRPGFGRPGLFVKRPVRQLLQDMGGSQAASADGGAMRLRG